MKLKISLFTFMFVFLFYLAIFIAGFVPFIAVQKMDISGESVGNYAMGTLLHPIDSILQMHNASNPLLYVCLAAMLILFGYLIYKTRHKDYENVGEKYGVQGSSRWAKNEEIFKVPKEITIIPANQMYEELKKTLK